MGPFFWLMHDGRRAPTGSRSGSGSARSRCSRRSVPAGCSARSGSDRSARSPPRSCTCSRRTSSRSPRGSRCCSSRGRRSRGSSGSRCGRCAAGRLARSRADRADHPDDRQRQRVVDAVRRCSRRRCGSSLELCRRGASRSAPRRRPRLGASRVLTARRLGVVDRRASTSRARTACPILQLTENVQAVVVVVDARRPPARARQLVLLRLRPPRATRSSSRPTTSPTTSSCVFSYARSRARAPRRRRSSAGGTAPTSCCSSSSARSSASAPGPTTTPRCRARVWKRSPSDTSAGLAAAQLPARRARHRARRRRAPRPARSPPSPGARNALIAAGVVAIVAFGALLPVWRHGYLLTAGSNAPRTSPATGRTRSAALDRESHATRILEIPGSAFATYRWGNTVEPITPGLTDRPVHRARGAPGRLAADRSTCSTRSTAGCRTAASSRSRSRPSRGCSASAPRALRSDLEYERFGIVRTHATSGGPSPTRRRSRHRRTPPPSGRRPRTSRASPSSTRSTLRDAHEADPPPVALFPVERPGAHRAHRARPRAGACSRATATASSTRPRPG